MLRLLPCFGLLFTASVCGFGATPVWAQSAPASDDSTSTLLGVALSGSPTRMPDSVVRGEKYPDLDTVLKALKGRRGSTEEFVWVENGASRKAEVLRRIEEGGWRVQVKDGTGAQAGLSLFAASKGNRMIVGLFTVTSAALTLKQAVLEPDKPGETTDVPVAPAPVKATPTPAKPTPAKPAPPAPVRLTALSARPGYIIDRATFADGRPVPNFVVKSAGMNGQFNPFQINQVGGPLVVQKATTFGDAKGANGRYQIHIPESALMFRVSATRQTQYHGQTYTVDLWPTDNKPDGTDPGNFRGHTTKGIARDFVVKLSGVRPGYAANKYPNNSSTGDKNGGDAYFGGSIRLDGTATTDINDILGKTALNETLPQGSVVTLTLTPTAPLLDGTTGAVLRRQVKVGSTMYLFDVPYGLYTVSASATDPGGAVHPIRLRNASQTRSGEPWGPSTTLEWHPLPTAFDDTGSVIIAERLYLVE